LIKRQNLEKKPIPDTSQTLAQSPSAAMVSVGAKTFDQLAIQSNGKNILLKQTGGCHDIQHNDTSAQ
jgi:hypothetical protein